MFTAEKTFRRLVATVAALAVAGSVSAHHSLVMFDLTKESSVHGVVTDWQWTNPHSWLDLEVMENGKPVSYSMEGNSPNMLTRKGWNRHAIKAGDVVTVNFSALKNGEKGGLLRKVTFENGTVLVP